MVFNNNLLLGAAGQGEGYTIDQSIRFNDNDSAYLYRAMGTGGDTKTGTLSLWVKRANLGTTQKLFDQVVSTRPSYISFKSDDTIEFYLQETAGAGYALYKVSSNLYRDVGSWYHIYATWDTTQSSPEWNLYVNGVQPTWATDNNNGMSQNANIAFFGNSNMALGRTSTAATSYADAYLAEINCIEGSVVAISEFAETNADTGQWVPKKYTGSYPGKSFYITGADSADLGADDSGNGNDFTSSGLTAADQVTDTPTNNFAVQNYVTQDVDNLNWSEGNLNILADSSARWHTIPATIYPQSGKWGYQATIKSSSGFIMIGWMSEGDIEEGNVGGGKYPYQGTNSNCAFLYNTEAQKYVNNTQTFTGGLAGLTTNDVVECLMDIDNGTISWKKNGSAYGPTYTGLNTTDNPLTVPMVAVYGGSSYRVELDYGQGGYTPSDSDYKTICTANLDDPTVALPEKYFNTVLYEGNGGGQRVGGFQPITETYTVPNSSIFNASDSNYLTRTPSGAGSATTITWSYWVKRAGNFAANNYMWGSFSSPLQDSCFFNTSDQLTFSIDVGSSRLTTTRVFRDSSTWLHVVLVWDSSNATSGDRMQMYIDGVRQTSFSTETYPSSGASAPCWNTTNPMEIGRSGFTGQHGDTYMADFYFIDGQALGPDSFGQLDASTNKWIPKDASGLTFGTNGFYLDFESGKESTSDATTTNMNATQFVNGSMGSWGTGDTAYDFTGGTADRNINTGTSFIPSSTDFDFYGTLSAAASPNAPFLGWYNSGTNTNAGTPSTTASAGVYGRNGNSTGSSSGWLLLSGTREAERPNKSWEFQRKVGVHRRGSQLYGSLNGRIDHKYSSTPSTTSAGGLFLGNSGDGTSYTWSDVHSITYSSTTQNQYGLDSSGNGNNFTEEGTWDFLGGGNLSYDTPTRNSLGFWDGEFETGGTETVPSFGNTKINTSTGNDVGTPSRGFVSSGKWYYEIDVLGVYNGTGSSAYAAYGVVDYDSYGDTYDNTASGSLAYGGKVVAWKSDGAKLDESSNTASVFSTISAGDVIQIALDMDNGAVWFGKNNTWELSATASEIENGDTSNAVRTGLTGEWSPVFHRWTGTERVEINAGSAFRFSDSELSLDTASGGYFKYTPPDGFKSLNNDNLPLSNGDLSAFVWIKNRDAADNHMLFDAVRGVTKDMHSNATSAEVTNANTLTRFLKNGFEVSNDPEVNTSAESYVAWQWLNDSLSTSSNTDGDITSTVLANTTSGVSVLTYSGNGTSDQTIGHGLGIAPKMIFSKRTDTTGNWTMYHDAVGINKVMYLNLSNLPASNTEQYRAVPTSSVYTVGSGGDINNASGTYVAYCFAEVDGFSKAGSYVANASTDGPFVYCGFKPSWVIFFSIAGSGAGRWMLDTVRSPFNVADDIVQANTTAAESSGSSYRLDFLSNGFKVRTSSDFNSSGRTIAFMAFAESPFKTATAR